MAWNDPDEIVVAGNGQVYIAPVGTALPTTPGASLNAAFFGLGYHTEEGTTFRTEPDIGEFRAWQARTPVRRELNAQEIGVTFELIQWNEESVKLAFGGGAVTSVSGGYRYDFPAIGDALYERALVLDAQDGTRKFRFVIPRGNVSEAVESQFQRSEMATLAIAFDALQPEDGSAPAYLLTDDTVAFASGS